MNYAAFLREKVNFQRSYGVDVDPERINPILLPHAGPGRRRRCGVDRRAGCAVTLERDRAIIRATLRDPEAAT